MAMMIVVRRGNGGRNVSRLVDWTTFVASAGKGGSFDQSNHVVAVPAAVYSAAKSALDKQSLLVDQRINKRIKLCFIKHLLSHQRQPQQRKYTHNAKTTKTCPSRTLPTLPSAFPPLRTPPCPRRPPCLPAAPSPPPPPPPTAPHTAPPPPPHPSPPSSPAQLLPPSKQELYLAQAKVFPETIPPGHGHAGEQHRQPHTHALARRQPALSQRPRVGRPPHAWGSTASTNGSPLARSQSQTSTASTSTPKKRGRSLFGGGAKEESGKGKGKSGAGAYVCVDADALVGAAYEAQSIPMGHCDSGVGDDSVDARVRSFAGRSSLAILPPGRARAVSVCVCADWRARSLPCGGGCPPSRTVVGSLRRFFTFSPSSPVSSLPASSLLPSFPPLTSINTLLLTHNLYRILTVCTGTHNPFGNARDDEPEFVEWGSKTNGTSTSSSSQTTQTQNGHAGAVGMGVVSSTGGDDDDDGSGMGWVRRRREARERERVERERKEREEAEKENGAGGGADAAEGGKEGKEDKEKDKEGEHDNGSGTPTPTELTSSPAATLASPPASASASASVPSPLPLPALGSASTTASPLGTPSLASATPPTSAASTEEHVLRAVNLPAHFRGHHHSHSHSHSHSHGHHRSASSSGVGLAGAAGAVGANGNGDAPAITVTGSGSGSSSSSSSSSSDSEDESEDEDEKVKGKEAKGAEDEDDDDDEDEDEDEEEEKRRVTALSAGVEKISRHKE
ncbi:hypothetical protein B0H13DRAFT_2658808 [Mycena leptocephala]|nr:hypothetical protein B0H13DRAFT_2658808 [Mycena leptocephala]